MVDKQKYIVKKSKSNCSDDRKNENFSEKKLNLNERVLPRRDNFQDINDYHDDVQLNYLDNLVIDTREIYCDDHLKENKKKSKLMNK